MWRGQCHSNSSWQVLYIFAEHHFVPGNSMIMPKFRGINAGFPRGRYTQKRLRVRHMKVECGERWRPPREKWNFLTRKIHFSFVSLESWTITFSLQRKAGATDSLTGNMSELTPDEVRKGKLSPCYFVLFGVVIWIKLSLVMKSCNFPSNPCYKVEQHKFAWNTLSVDNNILM